MSERTSKIETVELLKPDLPKLPPLQSITLPKTVVACLEIHFEREKREQIKKYQELYESGAYTQEEILLLVQAGLIKEHKNIFQIIQEKGMNAIFAFLLSWVKSNWRTTVAGVSVFAATTLANWGISLPQSTIDQIIGIGYVVIFGFSDFRWDLPTIVGLVLMLLSFFLPYLLPAIGLALSPATLLVVQQGVQAAISFLLKDQEQKFRNPLPAQ